MTTPEERNRQHVAWELCWQPEAELSEREHKAWLIRRTPLFDIATEGLLGLGNYLLTDGTRSEK